MAGIGFELKKIIPEARTCSDGKSVWVCRSDLYRSDAARYRAVDRNRFYLRSYRCDET